MIRFLKKGLKSILPQFPFMQRIYLGFYYLGIWGMNYGMSGILTQSGEKRALGFLKHRFGKKNLVLFDVGANSGEYALMLNSFFPSSTVHAFEPIPDMHQKIINNIRNHSGIQAHQIAFGDQKGELPIFLNQEETKLASLVTYRGNSAEEMSIMVPVNTIDDFCTENEINHIDLLKIDVEGYELNVLRGASKMISEGKIYCIQFEFGGTMIDSKTYFKNIYDLLNEHFLIHRILKHGLYPITQYHPHLEIFHFSNFIALKK